MANYQLTPFDVGQVKAHMQHGLSAASIVDWMFKADGETKFGETAIQNCIDKLKKNPAWRGERQEGSDRPRKTSAKQDKEVVRWLLKERGKQKVTVPRLKKQFAYLRKPSNTLVEQRLHEANLYYLRRRRKAIVTNAHLESRVKYCHDVKRKHQSTLEKWAYTEAQSTIWIETTRRLRTLSQERWAHMQ